MAGQLDIRIKHPRPRALGKIMKGSGHGSSIVEDVVAIDIGDSALETFTGAPFEELVFVD